MVQRKNTKHKIISFALMLAAIALTAAIIWVVYDVSLGKMQENEQIYPLKVSYIDVGQGDCILLKCNDVSILIDGGEQEYSDSVTDYLHSSSVSNIDCYVATHPHSDHIGAAPDIFADFNISKVIMTEFSEINMPTSVTFERFITAVENEGCEVLFSKAGDSYTFGELTVSVLSPYEECEDYNNMSVVIKVIYKNTSFLFMGDAEEYAEGIMLKNGADVNADVIKIGHHGSDSSTTPAFLKAVSPLGAVICCGKDNIYGHPSDQTVKLLKDSSIPLYRTDTDGTVVICSDGDTVYAGEAQ